MNIEKIREWRANNIEALVLLEGFGLTTAIDTLLAEVDRLNTLLSGRTYFHSDAAVEQRIVELETAVIKTLNENGHLAGGDNCTLIDLKRAMPTWEPE